MFPKKEVQITVVGKVAEMVKRNGEWYVHFVLKKEVELPDEPETVIGVDLGGT